MVIFTGIPAEIRLLKPVTHCCDFEDLFNVVISVLFADRLVHTNAFNVFGFLRVMQ